MSDKPTSEEIETPMLKPNFKKIQSMPSGETMQGFEEIYSSLFKNNHSAMVLFDPEDLSIVDANLAALSLYGWSHEKIITKKLTDIHILESETIYTKAQQAAHDEANQFFFQHSLPNGDIRDLEVHTSPITFNGKKLIFAIIHDITERKIAEKELLFSKQKLDLYTLESPLAMIEWDLDFRIRSWNPAAEKIFGHAEKDILGQHSHILFLEEGWETLNLIWNNLILLKDNKRTIGRNITKAGDLLFCEWYNTPVVDETGKTIGALSLVHDISGQTKAEISLQLKRNKLRKIINGIGDFFYVVSRNYTVEFQNKACLEKFGDLTGKTCFKTIFKLDEPCHFCLMPEALNTRSHQRAEAVTHNDKSYNLIFAPIHETETEETSAVILTDITEKKHLRSEAVRATHLASIGELAAGVAHEINNPVTGIISLAEILTAKFQELGGDRELPGMIIREGERISRIVKNLLSFARESSDEFTPVSLESVLKLAIELMERQVLKDGIHLSVSLPQEHLQIKARSQELQQVFINIISNARYAINKKYPQPSKDKTLEINGKKINSGGLTYVRLIFYDKGIGIPKSLMKKLTDPFFSTKPQDQGTGLGLSISHGIIENHGGHLWFESQEGEYTKVMVDLPLYGS